MKGSVLIGINLFTVSLNCKQAVWGGTTSITMFTATSQRVSVQTAHMVTGTGEVWWDVRIQLQGMGLDSHTRNMEFYCGSHFSQCSHQFHSKRMGFYWLLS